MKSYALQIIHLQSYSLSNFTREYITELGKIYTTIYEGRSINKLQNIIILLVFEILKI